MRLAEVTCNAVPGQPWIATCPAIHALGMFANSSERPLTGKLPPPLSGLSCLAAYLM